MRGGTHISPSIGDIPAPGTPVRQRTLVASWVPSRRRLWSGLAVSAVGPLAIAAVLLPARSEVDGAVFGLALLLPTAIGAALGGPVAAAVAVVEGSLTHNLLFTQPYLTLRVTNTTDVVDLLVHTIVAVAVSLVVVREQRATHLAARRGEQAARVTVLEEVDRMRTALLGAVSHDLRTPLSAIAAAASELQAHDVEYSDSERSVLAGTITEQAARLDRTVVNLLDAGRLNAGAVKMFCEAVEVGELVAEAVTGLGGDHDRVDVQVAHGTSPVLVDPMLVVAALRNLLDNALRHGPDGTPVEVTVADGPDAMIVLTVRDHGPGLADLDSDEIFSPFHSAQRGHVGLGLAIARGFVEAHGGQVHPRPAVGGGAAFDVHLPAIAEPGP